MKVIVFGFEKESMIILKSIRMIYKKITDEIRRILETFFTKNIILSNIFKYHHERYHRVNVKEWKLDVVAVILYNFLKVYIKMILVFWKQITTKIENLNLLCNVSVTVFVRSTKHQFFSFNSGCIPKKQGTA